ncbi:MAG: hypothetical protein JW744_01855 [Candidatus Diapherotrites archaeon]|uniref:Uncharacterized protein n=1 Tax=Candidatus Iainarchaeum sp. TaxID=3101447 RepID=A0A939C9Z2_9ARCH|nr:hypothetical protein [Candidatus Diapherotrites archaeon]
MHLNQRAFNLFTALVSFLLIILAVLLINAMMQSEAKANETIAGIESRSDLEAVAEMARADAMQIINFTLRYRIEEWLTGDALTLELHNKTWEEIQADFAESKFGGPGSKALAFYTAKTLEGLFHGETHFGNYRITFEESSGLQQGLETAIQKSVEAGDFFHIIECEGGMPESCPKGTFYVNLHLERLTEDEYESLPKLNVYDKATGKELKEVVLPRTNFRIYVPLRFFKAIAEARALTHYPLDRIDTAEDNGLFSPKVHNTIEDMALGMCDYGYCAPRNDPFKPPEQKVLSGKLCPGENRGELGEYWAQGIETELQCSYSWCSEVAQSHPTYNASYNDNGNDMKSTLKELATAKVCDVMKKAKLSGYLDVDQNDKFTLLGEECGALAESIEVNVEAADSKKLGIAEGNPGSIPGFSQPGYDAEQCGRNNSFGLEQARRMGLFAGIEERGERPVISAAEMQCTGDFAEHSSKCTEVTSISVTLAFKEEDPLYMVDKEGEKIYRINLKDNTYIPFTAAWDSGEMGNSCLYGAEPSATGCSLNPGSGWYCNSLYELEAGLLTGPGHAFKPTGCVPA